VVLISPGGLNWLDRGWIWVDNIRTDHFESFAALNQSKLGPEGVQKWPNLHNKIVSWWSQSALVVKTGWIWLDQGWLGVEDIRTDHFGPFADIKKVKIGAQGCPKVAQIRAKQAN
jgi:hypothetical protein